MRLGLVGNLRGQVLLLDHDETPGLLIEGARRLDCGVDQFAHRLVADRLVSIFARKSRHHALSEINEQRSGC